MKKIVFVLENHDFIKALPIYNVLKNDFELNIIYVENVGEKLSNTFFKELKFDKQNINSFLNYESIVNNYYNNLYVNNSEYLKNKDKIIEDLINIDDNELGTLGDLKNKIKLELEKINPDLVIVFGGSITALSSSIATKILNIEIAHIESDLISKDLSISEINRILIDHISTYYFVTEQSGIHNLKNEGLDNDNLFLIDNDNYYKIQHLLFFKRCFNYKFFCRNEITYGNFIYQLDNVFYLFKNNNNNNNIIISFHGALFGDITGPIFRNYEKNILNYDILSLSDKILENYDKDRLLLSWYLDTKKYKYNNIYYNIISNILKLKKYEKIYFFGTSGGGYSAIKYSCFFNAISIVSNSQIYLNKYFYFRKAVDILMKNNDEFIYGNSESIESITTIYKPKKIILFTNKLDTHHYNNHSLPFIEYCNNNKISNDVYFFEKESEKPHSELFNINWIDLL